MKDRMTYDLIRNLGTPQGIMCLLILIGFSVIPFAIAEPPREGCASDIISRIEQLSSSRALVTTDKIPTIQYEDAIQGRMPHLKNTPFFEFQLPDGGYVTVADISSPKVRENRKLRQAVKRWNVKTDAELRRLPKFSHLPPGSINSLDFPDRTVVIMKARKSINSDGNPGVEAGIRVVFARGADEQLPFQKDISEFVRAENAAEPGRLSGAGSTSLMLQIALRVIQKYRDIAEIDVHTSKPHATLYRRHKADPGKENTFVQDDYNWILQFDRLRIYRVIQKTKSVLEINGS
jgi:hypothetical protein